MNTLDLVVLGLLLSFAYGGWRLGFLARVASWIGLALGLYLGVRAMPTVIGRLGGDPQLRLLAAAAMLILAGFLGQALGLVLGHRVRSALPLGGVRTLDRAIGAVAGGVVVLVGLWLVLPAMADVPGWPSRVARNSTLAELVDEVFPPPPDTVRTLRRLVDESGFPQVFADLRPSPEVGEAPGQVPLSPALVQQVTASTVQVRGEACGRIQEGSGFAAGDNVVVTNAHVVAGQRATEVIRPDGRSLSATVALFDPDRDLAVLRVGGLNQRPLPVGDAGVGDAGAVFGHPGGQTAVRAAPAVIRQEVDAVGRDLYNRRTTRRQVYVLAAALRPGDSGGALVDVEGRVVGVAFAIAPDRDGTSYALTGEELNEVMTAFRRNPGARASTGSCLRR